MLIVLRRQNSRCHLCVALSVGHSSTSKKFAGLVCRFAAVLYKRLPPSGGYLVCSAVGTDGVVAVAGTFVVVVMVMVMVI
jgi:hypothetical protein